MASGVFPDPPSVAPPTARIARRVLAGEMKGTRDARRGEMRPRPRREGHERAGIIARLEPPRDARRDVHRLHGLAYHARDAREYARPVIAVDPMALAERQLAHESRARTVRFPILFARKLARMTTSPLAFLRGAAPLFYELLAEHPSLAEGPRGKGWIVRRFASRELRRLSGRTRPTTRSTPPTRPST